MEVYGHGLAVDEHVGVHLLGGTGQRGVHARDVVGGAAHLVHEGLLARQQHHGKEALARGAVKGGVHLLVGGGGVDLALVGVAEVSHQEVALLELLRAAQLLPEPLRDLRGEGHEVRAPAKVVLKLAGKARLRGELAVL